MLNFKEFINSKIIIQNDRFLTGIETDNTILLYKNGLFIFNKDKDGEYELILENQDYVSKDLHYLEEKLYNFYKDFIDE